MKIYDFITYRQVQTQCDWDLFLGRRIRRLSEFKFINHQFIFSFLLPIYMYIVCMYIDQTEINMLKSLEKSISKADIEGA